MIFTQYGVPVEIIGKAGEVLTVRGIDIPEEFIRERTRADLKADGGSEELEQAIAAAPIKPSSLFCTVERHYPGGYSPFRVTGPEPAKLVTWHRSRKAAIAQALELLGGPGQPHTIRNLRRGKKPLPDLMTISTP